MLSFVELDLDGRCAHDENLQLRKTFAYQDSNGVEAENNSESRRKSREHELKDMWRMFIGVI